MLLWVFGSCLVSTFMLISLLQTSILLAFLVGVVTYASILVAFTHFPSALSVRFLPSVFTLLVTLLIIMYLMEGQLRLINAKNGEDERFVALLTLERAQISLLGLYGAIVHNKMNAFSSWGNCAKEEN